MRRHTSGETVVVGHGEVGRTITDILDAVDLPYTVVDREDGPGVDVVGDATDPDVLEAAGLRSARSVILAIPDDTATEFATLVVRDESERVEIIARAEEAEAVQKMYRAGADYVLSLGTVTGRMVASAVLEDEDVISLDTQVEVVRTRAPGLVGKTLGEANVRARTGVTVVAVERDGEVVTDLGPDFRPQADDELIVAGPDEATNRFTEVFG
ncbi:MAG: TrkA family potassium uptake protein [Halosimplex sp.]